MTARSEQREDSANIWQGEQLKPLEFGRDEWRVTAIRGGRQNIYLDDIVETITWADNGPILTGAVTTRVPFSHPKLALGEGHQIRLEWRLRGQGAYREVWTMRLGGPVDNQGVVIDVGEQTHEYQIADDLALLAKDVTSYKIKKGKKHKNGLLVHEAIKEFCRQEKIPYGSLPKTKHRIKSVTYTNKSPLDILQALIRLENTNEYKSYSLRWVRGKVRFVPQVRSKSLLLLSETIAQATLTEKRRPDFATELIVHATANKGSGRDSKGKKKSKKKKLTVTVASSVFRRRYGRIRKTVNVEADSKAEARKKGLQSLRRRLKPRQDLTFTHAGIVSLKRQAAVRVRLKSEGFDRLIFVKTISHSISSGSYDMDLTFGFSDPIVADQRKRAAAKKKADAAARRARAKKAKEKDEEEDDKNTSSSSDTDTAQRTSQREDSPTAGEDLAARGRS